VTRGDSMSRLLSVFLPVDQIMHTPSTAAGSQQALNGVDGTAIDEARKWRGRSSGHQGALLDRLHSGDMEGRVDAHRVREL